MTERRRNPISSLFSLSIESVIYNLHLYNKSNFESLEQLPLNVKDRLLKKITRTPFFLKGLDFNSVFKYLVHQNTQCIDLTSVYVEDEILKTLQGAINLRSIDLTRIESHNVTRNGLINFFNFTKKLSVISICNCDVVDDYVLESISENCPYVTTLNLGGCNKITDNGLNSISRLKELKNLCISNTQITDNGIIEFVKTDISPNLKELKLDYCTLVTEKGLYAIAFHCTNLEILTFYKCADLGSRDNASVVEKFKMNNLKQLTWSISW